MNKKLTMLTYINDEQSTFNRILSSYPQAFDKFFPTTDLGKEWLILATGSSYNAAKSAQVYMERIAKIRIELQQPFNFQHYGQINPQTSFVIGISQSGQSTATINAIKSVKDHHSLPSMAVTSLPNTEISEACDLTLDIQTGHEFVGYVSRGFSATTLNLMLFALRFATKQKIISSEREKEELKEFRTISSQTNKIIEETTDFCTKFKSDFVLANKFSSIAYGPAVGTAKEMETKFTEIVRVPSNGYELESYMHGPYLSLKSTDRLFFISTPATKPILAKASALKNYESRYTSHIFTFNFNQPKTDKTDHTLNLPVIKDDGKVPFVAATVFQVLAWYIAIDHQIDLNKLIFDDFSDVVHNKTEHQQYV